MRKKSNGKPVNYTSIAIKGLLYDFKPTDATVIIDGKETRYKKVWIAPTMHGRFYGGGMIAAPDQRRDAPGREVLRGDLARLREAENADGVPVDIQGRTRQAHRVYRHRESR